MPGDKYKPVVSVAQRGKLFSLAAEGRISKDEAEGKARAAKGVRLPGRVRRNSKGRR